MGLPWDLLLVMLESKGIQNDSNYQFVQFASCVRRLLLSIILKLILSGFCFYTNWSPYKLSLPLIRWPNTDLHFSLKNYLYGTNKKFNFLVLKWNKIKKFVCIDFLKRKIKIYKKVLRIEENRAFLNVKLAFVFRIDGNLSWKVLNIQLDLISNNNSNVRSLSAWGSAWLIFLIQQIFTTPKQLSHHHYFNKNLNKEHKGERNLQCVNCNISCVHLVIFTFYAEQCLCHKSQDYLSASSDLLIWQISLF